MTARRTPIPLADIPRLASTGLGKWRAYGFRGLTQLSMQELEAWARTLDELLLPTMPGQAEPRDQPTPISEL